MFYRVLPAVRDRVGNRDKRWMLLGDKIEGIANTKFNLTSEEATRWTVESFLTDPWILTNPSLRLRPKERQE